MIIRLDLTNVEGYDMCSGCSDFTDGYLWQWCVSTHCGVHSTGLKKRYPKLSISGRVC